MSLSALTTSAAAAPRHQVRFIRNTIGLVVATYINGNSRTAAVFQPAFFRCITGISPRTVLGSVTLDDSKMAALGFVPATAAIRKEVTCV